MAPVAMARVACFPGRRSAGYREAQKMEVCLSKGGALERGGADRRTVRVPPTDNYLYRLVMNLCLQVVLRLKGLALPLRGAGSAMSARAAAAGSDRGELRFRSVPHGLIPLKHFLEDVRYLS